MTFGVVDAIQTDPPCLATVNAPAADQFPDGLSRQVTLAPALAVLLPGILEDQPFAIMPGPGPFALAGAISLPPGPEVFRVFPLAVGLTALARAGATGAFSAVPAPRPGVEGSDGLHRAALVAAFRRGRMGLR